MPLNEFSERTTSVGGVGTDRPFFESVRYSARCQDCAAEPACWGVQALVNGSLRWDAAFTMYLS